MSCKKEINGCTYSSASNYNSEATQDDGSCIVPVVNESIEIGDFYEGGVVFWLDGSKNHGLVCAVNDLGYTSWGDLNFSYESSDLIGEGEQNTAGLVLLSSVEGSAIDICSELNLNGFSDWFLPNKKELEFIAFSKAKINVASSNNGGGVFTHDAYWSSSTYFDTDAYAYNCNVNTGDFDVVYRSNLFGVRAVRSF